MSAVNRAAVQILAVASMIAIPTLSRAASIATDNASDPVYLDGNGWATGDNGGSGWGGGWTLSSPTGNSGHFVGDSAGNGGTNTPPLGDINSTGGHAWGLWANNANLSDARRPFDGALAVGQTFSIDMDNGGVDGDAGQPGSVGFGLVNGSTNSNLFEFFYRSGETNEYRINDATGTHGTAVPFTNQGLHLEFTLTGPQTYQLVFGYLGAPAFPTITGTLATEPIDGLRLFNFNAGPGGTRDAFFNGIAVTGTPVPLPAAAVGAVPLLGLLATGCVRRKQRQC